MYPCGTPDVTGIHLDAQPFKKHVGFGYIDNHLTNRTVFH